MSPADILVRVDVVKMGRLTCVEPPVGRNFHLPSSCRDAAAVKQKVINLQRDTSVIQRSVMDPS